MAFGIRFRFFIVYFFVVIVVAYDDFTMFEIKSNILCFNENKRSIRRTNRADVCMCIVFSFVSF